MAEHCELAALFPGSVQLHRHELHWQFDLHVAVRRQERDADRPAYADRYCDLWLSIVDHGIVRMRTMYLPEVVTLELNIEKCNRCGMCVQVCPHAVFALEKKRTKIVDRDACMECGACALNCPEGAISVRSGVGCAAGILNGALRGTEPTCGC